MSSINLKRKILRVLEQESMLTDEVLVQEYILNRKEQILKNHIENVYPIKEPGSMKGYEDKWLTKLTPKTRGHEGKIYARTREELEEKIIAYYLKVQAEEKVRMREALLLAVDETTSTGKRTVQRFDKHLSMLKDVKIASLSEKDIRRALDVIVAKKVTTKEFNQTITCLNKIADYCAYEHLEVCDIKQIIHEYRNVKLSGKHHFVDTKKETKNLSFNRTEAAAIVADAIIHPNYKSLSVALMIVTGLRAGELLGLKIEDVILDEGYLWIHQIEDTKSYVLHDYVKENKAREVYLSDEAIQVIKACIEIRGRDSTKSPYLFLNANSADGKMHLRSIDNWLRGHIHSDVLKLGEDREARSAHDCRRTYASLEYMNGTDIYTLKNQLGHSTIIQTENYIKDIIEASERRKRLKGCGVIARKPSIYAVDARGCKNEA